jgi:hypothetical protein
MVCAFDDLYYTYYTSVRRLVVYSIFLSPQSPSHLEMQRGERSYCIIGEWADMTDLAAARPKNDRDPDTFRDTLEDLGGGLGVTDPVSGPVVLELNRRWRHSAAFVSGGFYRFKEMNLSPIAGNQIEPALISGGFGSRVQNMMSNFPRISKTGRTSGRRRT